MGDALVVRVLQRRADLRHDGERLRGLQLLRLDELPQVRAIHMLHEEVKDGIVARALRRDIAEVVDGDDVGVVEPGEHLRLALEAQGKVRRMARRADHDLQRHQAVQTRLARLVNRAHAARAEQIEDVEIREKLPQCLQ